MNVIADVCIVPVGSGVSVSKEVAACVKLLREANLNARTHGYGTNLEGDWDDVFSAIKRCHELLHASGTVRISTTIRAGTRIDKDQTVQDKIDKVAE
ncbi:MAG: MTH1187 family thiamine-binding protein [Verrucomicrobiae bacterium]|nr:MTH1187 family thiamine-binding protein [Verrucomicrobiae bacterium]